MRSIFAIVGACALFTAVPAHASDATAGYVSQVILTSSGVVLFNQDGSRSGLPGCQGTIIPQRWAFDGTTPAGQEKAALLMTAYVQHKQVSIAGSNTCPAWPDSEDINFLIAA